MQHAGRLHQRLRPAALVADAQDGGSGRSAHGAQHERGGEQRPAAKLGHGSLLG